MKRIFFVFLLFLISCQRMACRQEQGKELYALHCASCHGLQGDGKGPVAQFLWPKPRDFTQGIFKYRTNRGPVPSDLDLLQTMYLGIPGTSMPGWYLLNKNDWESLLAHIKKFSPRLMNSIAGPEIDIPEEPKQTPESLQRGRDLFAMSGCMACHDSQGEGGGPASGALTDVWGNRVTPRDLTRGPMKWGNRSRDIYRTLSIGVPGTPMPGYEHTFTKEQMWGLVHYLQSIQRPLPEGYNPSDPKHNLLVVKKISGELPLDYENDLWKEAADSPVFLKPLWHEPKGNEWLTVKTLHNQKEIAFYLRWQDDQMNVTADQADAVAIQFPVGPVQNPIDLPFLGMGSESLPVAIWQWKAGNFLEWNAQGIGHIQPQKSAMPLEGKGSYAQGEWHVIFKKPLAGPKLGYLSFGLWDADLPKHHGPEAFSEWLAFELRD